MTYYEILEVTENASEDVIKMAYIALVKKYHPDVFTGNPQIAEEKMKQINTAYIVLTNVENRAIYDQLLHNKRVQCNNTVTQENTQPPNKKTAKIAPAILAVLIVTLVCALIILTHFGGTMGIEKVKDSVVMVEVYDVSGNLLATGSGFCAYEENWIITNFHVVEGAKSIKVVTDSHQKYSVNNIVFFNRRNDIAVLSINGHLKPLKLGNSTKLKIKDKITTIGSPKGELNTVSEGIISSIDDKTHIRISAPISHGSSGGVLLNHKNEVIGITSAGYDDAQNLNFAINISLLKNLFTKYTSDNTLSITDFSLVNHIGSLGTFANYLMSIDACYRISSIDEFYKLTNDYTRFEILLKSADYSWFSIYDSLNQSDKETVVLLFAELNEYQFDDNNVAGDIGNWDVTDFFLSLGVLNRYEYAITVVDIGNYADLEAIFDNLDNNYSLEAAEKSLIYYLIGECDWSEISTSNKEDIFDYFDSQYGTTDLGAILEVLGYEVVYENDGTLTAYW